jgi:hypothetical protein
LPPVDAVPKSADDAKADIKQAISDYATGLRNKAYAGTSTWEAAAWCYKFQEALKIIGYGASTTLATIRAQNPRICEEADIRGIDPRALAEKIAAKATAFYTTEAQISGIVGKHCDAVDKLSNVRDVLFYDWRVGWPEV